MFLVLAFMYTVCMTIKGLVLEKELRLKEVLRAVGVQNSALWFAWFAENCILLTVPCALISVMVKVSMRDGGSSRVAGASTSQSTTRPLDVCVLVKVVNFFRPISPR